jgi:hypothetical protein
MKGSGQIIDDDRVEGLRIRLLTATTNGPIFIPQLMYEYE